MNKKTTLLGLACIAWACSAMAQSPVVSDEEQTSYYFVASASSGAQGLAMTDAGADAAYPIALSALTSSADQQWRLESAGTNLVRLVNRQSGRILQPQSVADALYRIAQLGSQVLQGRGFTLQSLGSDQYALSGVEEDGGEARYLVAQQKDVAPTDLTAATAGSPVAWTFTLAERVNGIDAARSGAPRVSVENGRISVEPAAPFTVHTADGAQVSATGKLQPGLYLVTVAGRTVKVLITH